MPSQEATLSFDDALKSVKGDASEKPLSFEDALAAVRPKSESSTPDQSSKGAIVMQGVSQSAPALTTAVEELATNPNAWKAGKAIGEVAGGVAGLAHSGPLGAAGGMWGGAKVGWRTANALQKVAAPVAVALDKAAPYMQAVSTLSGAQGVLDIAQMADPKRTDIGMLGIGASAPKADKLSAEANGHATILRNIAAQSISEADKSKLRDKEFIRHLDALRDINGGKQ